MDKNREGPLVVLGVHFGWAPWPLGPPVHRPPACYAPDTARHNLNKMATINSTILTTCIIIEQTAASIKSPVSLEFVPDLDDVVATSSVIGLVGSGIATQYRLRSGQVRSGQVRSGQVRVFNVHIQSKLL